MVNNNDGTWILDGAKVSINEETGEIVVVDITNQTVEKTIEEVQENYVVGNTKAKDENGNKIVVPDGFKITNDTKKVNEGIVITDGTNEFVWVPVGRVSDGTNTYQINLSRYTFSADGVPTDMGNAVIYSYHQEETISTGLGYGNTIAKNIEKFIQSAKSNGGYYIGRYEASQSDEKAKSKKSSTTWTNINQQESAVASKEMYDDNKYYTSDLINSYAWDTAIIFIQTFGQSNYSRQIRLSMSKLSTGVAGDEQLNINDMAGNVYEWTTETSNNSGTPSIYRGGHYNYNSTNTANRGNNSVSHISTGIGFRPILYITL